MVVLRVVAAMPTKIALGIFVKEAKLNVIKPK